MEPQTGWRPFGFPLISHISQNGPQKRYPQMRLAQDEKGAAVTAQAKGPGAALRLHDWKLEFCGVAL